MPENVELVLGVESARFVRKLKKARDEFGRFAKTSQTSTTGVVRGFDTLASKLTTAGGRIKKQIFNVRNAFLALGAGAAAKSAVTFAADFEKSLANVSTLLGESGVSIERYRKQLLELSKVSSKELIDLTNGLYQAISAGAPAVEGAAGAFATLEAAQRAAVAGLSTTEQAVDGIVSVTNAYRESGLSAAEASDKLFQTVVRGRTTFPSLASNIGKVAGTAATFGVSIDDLLGSLAAVTRVLPSTEASTTSLQAIITGIVKPSQEAAEEFERLGIDASAAGLAANGLTGTLSQLRAAVDGDNDALARLFPNVRALRGAAVLLGSGFEDLTQFTAEMGAATGATDAALGKIQPTFSETAAIFKSQLQAVLVEAGTRVLPQLGDALARLGATLVENQDKIADAFSSLITGLSAVGEFVVRNGETILSFVKTFVATFVLGKILAGLRDLRKDLIEIGKEAGRASGKKFGSGFSRAFRSLRGLFSVALRNLGVVGIAIAAGKEVVDAIFTSFREESRKAREEFVRGTVAAVDQISRAIRGISFKEAIQKAVEALRGERIGAGRATIDERVKEDPAAALREAEQDAAGLREQAAGFAEDATEQARQLNEAEAQRAANQERLNALRKREQDLRGAGDAGLGLGPEVELRRIRREAERLEGRIGVDTRRLQGISDDLNASTAAAETARAGAESVLARTEAAVEALVATQGGEGAAAGGGAGGGAGRASTAAGDARAVESAAKARLAATNEALEAEAAAREAFLSREVESAGGNAREVFEARSKLIDAEEAHSLAALTRERDARIEAAGEDAVLREAFERRFAADVRQLQESALADRISNLSEFDAARRQSEADQIKATEQAERDSRRRLLQEFSARGARARSQAEAGAAARNLAEPLIRTAGAFGADSAGNAIAEAALALSGPVGGLVKTVVELPAILDGLSEFLTSGVADFIEDLARAAGDFVQAILIGLPNQVDRILTVIVPNLVQSLVGALPEVIAGLIALFPRLVVAFAKSVPAIAKALALGIRDAILNVGGIFDGLRDGAQEAGDAFLAGVRAAIKALEDFVDGIGNAFSEAGDQISGAFSSITGGSTISKERLREIQAEQRAQREALAGVNSFTTDEEIQAILDQLGLTGVPRNAFESRLREARGDFSQVGLFHEGGMIGPGLRSLAGAAAFAAAGAQRFGSGGFVRSILGNDDVPIIAQAGEAVLSRRGVEAAGGTGGVNALNRGDPPVAPSGQPVVELVGRDGDEIARTLAAVIFRQIRIRTADPLGGGVGRDLAPSSSIPFFQPVPARQEV